MATTIAALTLEDIDQIVEGIEHFIVGDNGPEVEANWQPYSDKLKAQRAALAAAPELLDALKNLMRRHEWVPGLGPCICPEHVAARAVIAKAEGR